MEKERLDLQKLGVAMGALIDKSCSQTNIPQRFHELHSALVKRNFNALEVSIDYHRKRVYMDIVLDDHDIDIEKGNLLIPTFRTNLIYQNLEEFLNSCVALDGESSSFYDNLLRRYSLKTDELNLC